jgi:hypothetical protein
LNVNVVFLLGLLPRLNTVVLTRADWP